jgi:hypothetical protein
VLCAAPPCLDDQAQQTTAALKSCVRSSRHGVLVTSGCTLGPVGCRLRPAGQLLVVQPCGTDRHPIGPAVRVGPIRTDDDLAAVQEWIRTSRFDPLLLPPHRTSTHRTLRGATQN